MNLRWLAKNCVFLVCHPVDGALCHVGQEYGRTLHVMGRRQELR